MLQSFRKNKSRPLRSSTIISHYPVFTLPYRAQLQWSGQMVRMGEEQLLKCLLLDQFLVQMVRRYS
uniref:Uncharacterized protein n=1 Tax=Octopus bimaculoides TaxID=37653 RepID=A0A0L8I7G9_OCTBM